MNQICHFEFIVRFAPSICLLVWLVAIPSTEETCFAQEAEPQSYRAQWTAGHRSTQWNRESNNKPPLELQVIETRFNEPVAATQSPSAPQSDSPASNETPSSLSSIIQFLSAQTQKLFGSSTPSNGPDYKRIIGSLSLVLGCYFALVWILRMISPASNKALPSDVVEVLGKTPFGNRQHLQLVRIGSRLLLLLETNDTIQPIAEVSDPEEVHQLLSLCEQNSRAGRRHRSRPARNRSPIPEPKSEVHSFRIPAVNSMAPERHPSDESDSANLANLIRVFENATGKNSSRYKNSYEA